MPVIRSRTDDTVSALIAMATGVGLALLVHMPPARGDAPAWVGDTCAAAFFLAGLAILANTRRWPVLIARLAGAGAAYMLVVPALWVVIGGDPARCSVGATFAVVSMEMPGSTLCLSMFGFGALLASIVALAVTWHAVWGARAGSARRLPN